MFEAEIERVVDLGLVNGVDRLKPSGAVVSI